MRFDEHLISSPVTASFDVEFAPARLLSRPPFHRGQADNDNLGSNDNYYDEVE